jgi:hypothetical protein
MMPLVRRLPILRAVAAPFGFLMAGRVQQELPGDRA